MRNQKQTSDSLLDLEGLSEEERAVILQVLKRDEQLRQAEDQKISQLKHEIQSIRMKSVLRSGDDLSKLCARCHGELGLVFNRGDLCPQCKFRVCKGCQECLLNGKWLCSLCYRQRQLKILSGDWDAKNQGLRRWPSGADLVKASIKKSLVVAEPDETKVTPEPSSKTSSRLHSNGAAHRDKKSHSSSHGNKDRVEFPQESDRAKLTKLFDSIKNSSKSTTVIRASSKHYSESDSSSTSDDDHDHAQIHFKGQATNSRSSPSANAIPYKEDSHSENEDINVNEFKTTTARGVGQKSLQQVHSFDSDQTIQSDEAPFSKSSTETQILVDTEHSSTQDVRPKSNSPSKTESCIPMSHQDNTSSDSKVTNKDDKFEPIKRRPEFPPGRSPSPYSFDSIPSSHANSPLPQSHRDQNVDAYSLCSSGTDTQTSVHGDFSGTESLVNDFQGKDKPVCKPKVPNTVNSKDVLPGAGETDDYVIEESTKFKFARVSVNRKKQSPSSNLGPISSDDPKESLPETYTTNQGGGSKRGESGAGLKTNVAAGPVPSVRKHKKAVRTDDVPTVVLSNEKSEDSNLRVSDAKTWFEKRDKEIRLGISEDVPKLKTHDLRKHPILSNRQADNDFDTCSIDRVSVSSYSSEVDPEFEELFSQAVTHLTTPEPKRRKKKGKQPSRHSSDVSDVSSSFHPMYDADVESVNTESTQADVAVIPDCDTIEQEGCSKGKNKPLHVDGEPMLSGKEQPENDLCNKEKVQMHWLGLNESHDFVFAVDSESQKQIDGNSSTNHITLCQYLPGKNEMLTSSEVLDGEDYNNFEENRTELLGLVRKTSQETENSEVLSVIQEVSDESIDSGSSVKFPLSLGKSQTNSVGVQESPKETKVSNRKKIPFIPCDDFNVKEELEITMEEEDKETLVMQQVNDLDNSNQSEVQSEDTIKASPKEKLHTKEASTKQPVISDKVQRPSRQEFVEDWLHAEHGNDAVDNNFLNNLKRLDDQPPYASNPVHPTQNVPPLNLRELSKLASTVPPPKPPRLLPQTDEGSEAGSKLSPRASSEGSASFEDSGHVSGSSTQENTPEHRRTESLQSHMSIQSSQSTVTDRDEDSEGDIDELVAFHKAHSAKGSSYGNLLAAVSASKESLASFYSNAGDVDYRKIPVSGEIQFGIDYNYRTSSLEVTIRQCKNLAPADTKHNKSDPYVKTYLLPDKTRGGKRKTKVKKGTLNPVFDESLRYLISKSELENRTLWVTVWHNDRFGRNDFLGEVSINFDYFRFGDSSLKWYKLQEKADYTPAPSLLTYRGDLIISIKFTPADKIPMDSQTLAKRKLRKGKNISSAGGGCLSVVVKEARNLTAVRANGFSDPFCKGYLLPDKHRSGKQKTPVVRRNCNPAWNHTFIFDDVTIEELRERSLELTIWDHDKLASNEFLGGVRLNLGLGRSSGRIADWMDAKGEEISMWQAMLDRPNCWIDGTLILRPNMDKRKY